jgi:S1/P1 Nuclease
MAQDRVPLTTRRAPRLRVLAHALAALALGGLLGNPRPVLGWNDTGHEVIALIAWETLSPPTRLGVVDVLRQAPADAGLARIFPGDQRPLPVRQREFFRRASTWADLVRHSEPAARHAYHRPGWHFRNMFWRPSEGGPLDLPNMPAPAENVVERLEAFRALLADPGSPTPTRAVGLAWVLHLVGDVHQPFHCSSRVTRREPEGDQGGNLFRLGPRTDNLHAYWDAALDRAVPRRRNESTSTYLARVAALVVARHPRTALAGDLRPGKFEDWALESLAEAKAAYPPTLRRGQDPPRTYVQTTARVAMERAARAAYRLAALLEEIF